MGIKSFLAKQFATIVHRQTVKWSSKPKESQLKVFQSLIHNAQSTMFADDHEFSRIRNYQDFADAVPIRDYEALKPYIKKILEGGENILWHGKPLYFAKTSGTTSGAKYIPITKESMPNHINTARNALLSYVYESGSAKFLSGKLIFLSGSPKLEEKSGIKTGRLSGIVNHHVPQYLRTNQLPSLEVNMIEDWEQKLGEIVTQTLHEDMTLISGIPPWVQMYFDWLQDKEPEKIGNIFPNLELLVYGGVNFEPYREKLFNSIGRKIATIETFPASEGFFAFQDKQNESGMLLQLNSGIFYEFVPVNEMQSAKPKRLTIREVELGENYAMIISTNAGLWAYNIGDTIKFVSKNPYKIVVTGRIKHFISAFGEHVISEEVEQSLAEVARKFNLNVVEFTVAPQVNPQENELPYHEWFIEFENKPADLESFAKDLDSSMQQKNIYYKDLIQGKVLQPLKISCVSKDTFRDYMKSQGKLGGQNKLPRLSNDREIVKTLTNLMK